MMSSVLGGYEKCRFDGKPCPAVEGGPEEGCFYNFDCRRSYYDILQCRRHPEKAARFLKEEYEDQKAHEELSKAADWKTISDRQALERYRAFRGFDPLPEEFWDDITNRGALFQNDEKADDDTADYHGTLNVDGVKYWLSGWISTSKSGRTYLKITFTQRNG